MCGCSDKIGVFDALKPLAPPCRWQIRGGPTGFDGKPVGKRLTRDEMGCADEASSAAPQP
jgi:hypothetical protein